ncbi:hypothetical protein Tco_0713095 [Tanacetum coccineum]
MTNVLFKTKSVSSNAKFMMAARPYFTTASGTFDNTTVVGVLEYNHNIKQFSNSSINVLALPPLPAINATSYVANWTNKFRRTENFNLATNPANFNLVDPVERNTDGVPAGGWVAISGQKKAMVFYQMETEEVSDRFVAPCFVNGLEAYDGEINLGVEENMISNEYVIKLCLEHEVKKGNKVVKKELIIALRGEIYFVKFIINPEEDDVEPGVIFGRSFLRMTKAITDFGSRTVTIYLDIDPFLEETEEEEKSKDDWDHLLDFNIEDIPLLGEGLPPFV